MPELILQPNKTKLPGRKVSKKDIFVILFASILSCENFKSIYASMNFLCSFNCVEQEVTLIRFYANYVATLISNIRK